MLRLIRHDWIYPVYGAPIEGVTLNLSQQVWEYTMGANLALKTPAYMFRQAVRVTVEAMTTRWNNFGYNIDWTNCRVGCDISYGIHALHVHNLLLANHIVEFDGAMNARADSFDLEYFRLQNPITLRVEMRDFTKNRGRQLRRRNLGGGFPHIDVKHKLFLNKSLEGYFYQTAAVMEVPTLPSNSCFPMAFMKSQLRRLFFDEFVQETDAQSTLEAFENSPKNQWNQVNGEFDPYNCPRLLAHGYPTDFFSGDHFQLFNGYKQKISATDQLEEYASTSREYNECWEMAALDMHDQVANAYGNQGVLDYQFEDEVCMAYSKFFQVHIHLYNLLGNGDRYITYVDPTVRQYKRHIHMLVESRPVLNHCAAITFVRHFIGDRTKKLSLHNFCDICTRVCKSNLPTGRDHCKKCLDENANYTNVKLKDCEDWLKRTRLPFNETSLCSCVLCGTNRIQGKTRSRDCRASHVVTWVKQYECDLCREIVEKRDIGTHRCLIRPPQIKEALPKESIWVYDIEAQQNSVGELLQGSRETPLDLYRHEVILVCLRRVYADENGDIPKHEFLDIESFCDFMYGSAIMDGSTILAHNGGGYDHQYVLTYLEKHLIKHSIVPHAANKHRFIALEMEGVSGEPRRFLDFMAFVPGSLKNIGKDFGLSIAKGDFPHVRILF